MSTTEIKPNGKNEVKTTCQQESKVPARRVEPIYMLQSALNKLFDEFTMNLAHPWTDDFGGMFIPRIEIKEDEKAVTVSVELPGVASENVEVKLSGDRLYIKGHKSDEREEKSTGYYRSERSFGSFQRIVPMPCEVDRDGVEAVSKDGLLTITLPKTKAAQSEARKITVKKA